MRLPFATLGIIGYIVFESNAAAQQLIQPERNQLAFHSRGLGAWLDSSRPVNLSVRYLCGRRTLSSGRVMLKVS
jgi:hypothetical protein